MSAPVVAPKSSGLVGLVTSDALSLLGNQVAAVALPVLVLEYTHSALTTGIASAFNVVPVLVAAAVGGRAIDRIGAWNVSVLSDLLSFLSVMALPLCFLFLDIVPPAVLFSLVLIGALFDPSGVGARQTLVAGLADRAGKSLESVNSLRGALENGADFAGPVLGVALIAAVGVIATFFVNAASFLLCAIVFALSVPRGSPPAPGSLDTSISAGLRFILSDSQLRPLALVGGVAGFAILPFVGLFLPLLAVEKFDTVLLLGIAVSSFGMGATAGAAAFGWLARRLSLSLIYYAGLTLTGVAMAACALATTPWQVVLGSLIAGLLLGAGNPLEQTVIQRRTPQAIAGQVFTSMTAVRFAAGPLGLLAGGVVSQWINMEAALFMAGGLLFVSAALGAWFLPLRAEGVS
jgi:MFS family permease